MSPLATTAGKFYASVRKLLLIKAYATRMIHDLSSFRDTLRAILEADDGLAVESEGTVYVRSLEGKCYVAGILSNDGSIEKEFHFESDIEAAIDYFLEQRGIRNHGSVW